MFEKYFWTEFLMYILLSVLQRKSHKNVKNIETQAKIIENHRDVFFEINFRKSKMMEFSKNRKFTLSNHRDSCDSAIFYDVMF